MIVRSEQQPAEFDHIRDTLTDLVGSVGEANSNIKQLKQENRERFNQQDKDIAELKADNVALKSEIKALDTRFDQLELLIRQSLPGN